MTVRTATLAEAADRAAGPAAPDDRFPACLDGVLAADPSAAPWSGRDGAPVGIGLLSALRGGPVGPGVLRELTVDAFASLYRRLYWTASRADLLPEGADRAMLALAIAVGPHRATLIVQRLLGLEEDGVLDPATLPVLAPETARALEAALDAARRAADQGGTATQPSPRRV